MIWGLVFSYLEGRKATEFMGAVLSVSFIFSSGVVKTIGKGLVLNGHVSEFWMPFYTGSIFLIPLFLLVIEPHAFPNGTGYTIALCRKAADESRNEETSSQHISCRA